ncbi:MAG: PhnD/SsuA/transferrin family substrate-binding protein [Candidatus Solibacter sp.]|nr:PhnD/SsuA/transferrin family substrate-binding protein [Candidatus Solibacter sp.]
MRPGRDSIGLRPLVTVTGWTRLCRFAPVLGVALGAALAQQAPSPAASGGAGGLRHARLNGVVSSKAFSNLNRNDARAAIKAWFDIVARQRGFVLDSKIDIVDSVAEIRERLKTNSAELLILGVTDYLELESSRLAVPALTHAASAQGGALYSYVLLVKPSSGATTIAGLRGKDIVAFSRSGSNAGLAWIDVVLGKEKLGRSETFFASVKTPDKAQACILPLFFGTVDACVVDEVNLNLAKEMNPQLGQLRVLARSRPMVGSVIATPVEPHPYQNELIDAILSLHEDARGRQLLMVFKTERVVRIQPGDIDSARELWRDYYRLPGSSPNRLPGSAPPAESNQADRGKERD